MFFFNKQVRILPEIDWYHCQNANVAPAAIIWHRIKTAAFFFGGGGTMGSDVTLHLVGVFVIV